MFILLAKSASKVHLTTIILERKKGFFRLENKKVKKSKNQDFSKSVSQWFSSKI